MPPEPAAKPLADRAGVAYLLLWFPKASETFIFREIKTLAELGLSVPVLTLYGKLRQPLSPEMRAFPAPERLGLRAAGRILGAFFAELIRRPRKTLALARRCLGSGFGSLERLGENLWAFFAGFLVARRCAALGVSHIHAPWAKGEATTARVAAALTGIPFSFAARAGDIYPPEPALASKAADAAFVRVNHGANLAYLSSFCGDDPDKVVLVYNALSLPPRQRPETREPGPWRLLAAGRFVPTKGFDDLLEACARLRDQGTEFRLVLAGDGALGPALRRGAKRLGIENRVEFPGFLSHDALSEAMLQADVFIMPSVVAPNGARDGIPNVILEALVHGLPVVATDVAGIPEVLRPDTGWPIPQHDPEALANTLNELLARPEEAARRAGTGRNLILERFDPATNARRLADLFAAHGGQNKP